MIRTYDCAVNALIRMYLRHHSNQECGTPTCGELMRLEACCAKCEVRLEACYAKCPNSFLIHYPPPPVPDPLAPQPLAPPHPAPHAAHSQWLAAGSCVAVRLAACWLEACWLEACWLAYVGSTMLPCPARTDTNAEAASSC